MLKGKGEMKRVIYVLVLVVAFALMTNAALCVDLPYTLETTGTGTAVVSTDQAHSLPNSAKLATVTTSDQARIAFNPTNVPVAQLKDIAALNYWVYTVQAGDFNQLTAWIAIYLHTLPGKTYSDWVTDYMASSPNVFYMQAEPYYTYVDHFGGVDITPIMNIWYKVDAFDLVAPLEWESLESTGSPHGAPTLAQYVAGAIPNYSSREYGTLYICAIKIRMGYGGPWANTLAYVDDIRLNTQYLQTFDPPPAVGGEWVPTNTVQMMVQIVGFAAVMSAVVASFVSFRRIKRKQN